MYSGRSVWTKNFILILKSSTINLTIDNGRMDFYIVFQSQIICHVWWRRLNRQTLIQKLSPILYMQKKCCYKLIF